MKGLVYTAPYQVEVRNLECPQPGADEVLIQVSACGICGSDVHGFQGKSRIRVPPMVMGHEFSGHVVSAHSDKPGLRSEQRVVVQPLVGCGTCAYCLNGKPNICPRRELIGAHRQGAFAEFVRVPARLVYPIGPSLSDSAGTLVEPLANAVHMLTLGGGALDRNVVVLGAGTLGLVTVALARLAGARRVIVIDVDDRRLRVAGRLGADEVLNARGDNVTEHIVEITNGGADLVIDAAGYTASRRQGIAVVAPGGTVVFLGLADPTSEVSFLDVINREIVVRGSYASTDSDFRHALAILEGGRFDTESWVHSASLEDGQRYFDALSSRESDLIKVVFSVGE